MATNDFALWIVVFYTAGFAEIGMEIFFWGGTGHDAAWLVMGFPLVCAYVCAACLLQTRSIRRWLSE